MKFIDQRIDPNVKFKTLSAGELFLSCGEPFLRIKTIKDLVHNVNAVDLVMGEPYSFDDEDTVEKVYNAELVLKG